jgi:hypothetical protein
MAEGRASLGPDLSEFSDFRAVYALRAVGFRERKNDQRKSLSGGQHRNRHPPAVSHIRARPAGAVRLQLEEVPVCARCRAAGKIDTNLLNQMSALVSAQGYSLTNKVLLTCNGWLMEAKRPDGSPAVVFVDPKTQTIVDADFR